MRLSVEGAGTFFFGRRPLPLLAASAALSYVRWLRCQLGVAKVAQAVAKRSESGVDSLRFT